MALLFTACDPGGFLIIDPPIAARLEGVYAVSVDQVLAVGERGTVFRYDGELVIDTSTDADPGPRVPGFYGIARTGAGDVVVGDDGTALSGRGGELMRDDSTTGERLLALTRTTETVLYAGGEGGRLIRKRASAAQWNNVDTGVPRSAKITSIWGISESTVAFSTDSGFVFDRVGGDFVGQPVETFTSSATPLFGVWSSTAGADMFAVGLGGSIFRRAGGDSEWAAEDSPVTQDLYAIYGTGPDRIFVVGARGTILRYDGMRWKAVPNPSSSDLYAVHATPDGAAIFAVGDNGTMLVFEE